MIGPTPANVIAPATYQVSHTKLSHSLQQQRQVVPLHAMKSYIAQISY